MDSRSIKPVRKAVKELEPFRDNARPVTLCLFMDGIKVYDSLGNILMAHNMKKVPMVHREREFCMFAFVGENPSDRMKHCHVFDMKHAHRIDMLHGLLLRIMTAMRMAAELESPAERATSYIPQVH